MALVLVNRHGTWEDAGEVGVVVGRGLGDRAPSCEVATMATCSCGPHQVIDLPQCSFTARARQVSFFG